jgi:hypothetical protein
VYWKDDSTNKFRSTWVISADIANGIYDIEGKTREYAGQPGTDDSFTMEVAMDRQVVFLQTMLSYESSNNINVWSLASPSYAMQQTIAYANSQNTSYTGIDNIEVKITSWILNDEPGLICVGQPFLFDVYTGDSLDFAYPRNFLTRSSGGDTLDWEDTFTYDFTVTGEDKSEIIPEGWEDAMLANAMDYITVELEDQEVDISDILDVVDGLETDLGMDEDEDCSSLKLFPRIKCLITRSAVWASASAFRSFVTDTLGNLWDNLSGYTPSISVYWNLYQWCWSLINAMAAEISLEDDLIDTSDE